MTHPLAARLREMMGRAGVRRVHRYTMESFAAAFASRLQVAPSGCLEWIGPLHSGGYGYTAWPKCSGGRRDGAHRVAWALQNGPIPDGLAVCHRCNNKLCCNASHLYLATRGQNVTDAGRDGLLGRKESGICKSGHHHGKKRGRCPECRRINDRKRRARNRDKAAALAAVGGGGDGQAPIGT